MVRLFVCLTIFIALLSAACSKSNVGAESALYGTWVNSNTPGDTLVFMHKAGKNILRSNVSFNSSMPAYSETEYTFRDGILSRELGTGSSAASFPINSFTWIQQGKQFEILGYQLYLFMSSSVARFSYTKI